MLKIISFYENKGHGWGIEYLGLDVSHKNDLFHLLLS